MMKRILLPLLVILCIGIHHPINAQNYITQHFDTASDLVGWKDTSIIPSLSCPTPYGCNFGVQPPLTGRPGPATHAGRRYAMYNSANLDTGSTAELSTPAMNFSVYSTGYNQVTFWMYRDTASLHNDSIAVFANTTVGATGGTLLGGVHRGDTLTPVVPYPGWYQYTFRIPSSFSGSSVYVVLKSYSQQGNDMYIDELTVDHIPPCSGIPSATTTPSGTIVVCPGSLVSISTSIAPASGLSYNWQYSLDGTTWVNKGDTLANDSFFVAANEQFRVIVKCANSGLSDTTDPLIVKVSSRPNFAALPYVQNFEGWSTICASQDVPDTNWSNYPQTGNSSWRRDDEGFTAAGWTVTGGAYSPAAAIGSHSARFHAHGVTRGARGELALNINCSTITGTKELRFYYINPEGGDSLNVYLSTDSGASFTSITHLTRSAGWAQFRFPFTTNSSKVVIRFSATSDSGNYDMGLDYVQVIGQCSGKPTAGKVDTSAQCANVYFPLILTGTSTSALLSYQWQSSSDSIYWSNLPADTVYNPYETISSTTYFRVIVKCRASGQTDTTAGARIRLKPFYYCYCNPLSPDIFDDPQANIGNVKIQSVPAHTTILNNGTPFPVILNSTATRSYSNFDTLSTAPLLFLDSQYRATITEISQYASLISAPIAIFIDFNHDALFNDSERVFESTTSGSTSSPTVTDSFTIPLYALTGITGMRVKIGVGEGSGLSPCGRKDTLHILQGEYEDYLVNVSYPPCNGFVRAGFVSSTDTTVCFGYPFVLTDTTHDKTRIGVNYAWQESPDGITWGDVPGGANTDTITQVYTATVWYRFRAICTTAHDTSYSDTLHLTVKPPYKCYCYSAAIGGNKDTSDVGAFSIGSFSMSKGGAHLGNVAAVYGRQDFTNNIIDLYIDTTYRINLFYILKYRVDVSAKATLFIDYNNSLQYDIPTERVWSTIIPIGASFATYDLTVPFTALTGVPTGMRLVVNNNANPNSPSDTGCRTYISGETMDFVVRFTLKSPDGVGTIAGVNDLAVYPNPSDGIFNVTFNTARTIGELRMNVTDMTGRQVAQRSYKGTTGKFTENLDLDSQPKGIYFLEVVADGERMIRKIVIR
ncbi:MAG: T9SS type A sorting domain-containing protein [Taibaiella sp.]|nr:T9SS type A sorting domain-containing protein [Taibaiella sp.]